MPDILLVDNEPDSVENREKWLTDAGYNVFCVTKLGGAWEYIKDYVDDHKGNPPLVLLDIMMPITDDLDWLADYEKQNHKITAPTAGLEFAEKLQKTYPKIKITWHSVRQKAEFAVAEKIKKLGFTIIAKDLQNKTEFIKEVDEAFGNA